MARRVPIVEVEWEDAAMNTTGWDTRPERGTTILVRTAGFLVRKDKKYIAVTLNRSTNGTWADTQVIPRVNVKRIRMLGRSNMKLLR